MLPGQGSLLFGTPAVQIASSDTSGFVTGSFFNPGNHDIVVASSQGITPLPSLLGKAGVAASAPFAEFNRLTLDFGTALPGSPVSLQLAITNTGNTALDVPLFGISHANGSPAPEYSTTGVKCNGMSVASIVVAPNAACIITFQLNPPFAGTFPAQLTVLDNAPQSNVPTTRGQAAGTYVQVLPLAGTGALGPVQLSPTTLYAAMVNAPYYQPFFVIGGTGGYTFKVSGALPAGITFFGGALTGKPTKAGTFPIIVTVTDSAGSSASLNYQLTVGCGALTISPPSQVLPVASIGLIYDQAFTFSGQPNGSYSWLESGRLPFGLQFNGGSTDTSSITGRATLPAGLYSFALAVTDSAGCMTTNNYRIVVAQALTVTANLPTANAGIADAGSFAASGGTAPYTYFTLGTPPGLTLSTQTGTLFGVPTQAGSYPLTVLATDSQGVQGIVAATLLVQGSISIVDNETIVVSDQTAPSVLGLFQNDSEQILVSDVVTVSVRTESPKLRIALPPGGTLFAGTPFSGTLAFTGPPRPKASLRSALAFGTSVEKASTYVIVCVPAVNNVNSNVCVPLSLDV